MKTLVISMLILLIALFSLIPVFAQPPGYGGPPGYGVPPQPGPKKEKPAQKPEQEKTADANSIADSNAAADANAVRAKIEEFEGLGEALEQVEKESKDEIREWTRSKAEDKLDLALAVQKQITAEFNFLRKLAVEEGAVKTTAAIDVLLLDRQERFGDIIEKLEKERERLRRRSEREERKGQDRDRGRERSRDRVDRSRRSGGVPQF